jgi:hypothetical protein
MNKLDAITPTLKKGGEHLKFNNKNIEATLLDFWRWSTSDILSNVTRGVFAEFIVATAMNIDVDKPRNEWSAYDLITSEGARIEVKSSAYLQSWTQKRLSNISFSITPARYWDRNGKKVREKKRNSDVYVFCLLKTKDKSKVDPLDLSQWEFYVLSTEKVNVYERSDSSITLNSLKKLTEGVKYDEIKMRVEEELQSLNKNINKL